MNKELTEILKELKEIAPDAGYSVKSRNLLMAEINRNATFQKKVLFGDILTNLYSRKLTFITVATMAVILVISGSAFYVKNEMANQSFIAKANEANASIKIKLEEIKYILGSESIDYNKGVAIQLMLAEATKNLKEAAEENDTKKSLEKIKSAQEIFSQIDILLKE